MKEYGFILSDKKYTVSGEKELAALLKLFLSNKNISSVIHWNILMELDSDLEKIVTSYQGLLNCLKYLNEKNSFLLLVKLGDVLINLINNSSELAEILSRIPEETNKIKLLNILRFKGLTKILFDARDLGNIFEWLYGESQRKFIDLLGKDFVKNLFSSTNEIIMILHFLNNENKDYLMSIIGLDLAKTKIKTSSNFLVMFKGLTFKNAKKFLKKFEKKEILDLFKSEDEFYNFLLRLPSDKEKLFLNYLSK